MWHSPLWTLTYGSLFAPQIIMIYYLIIMNYYLIMNYFLIMTYYLIILAYYLIIMTYWIASHVQRSRNQ